MNWYKRVKEAVNVLRNGLPESKSEVLTVDQIISYSELQTTRDPKALAQEITERLLKKILQKAAMRCFISKHEMPDIMAYKYVVSLRLGKIL